MLLKRTSPSSLPRRSSHSISEISQSTPASQIQLMPNREEESGQETEISDHRDELRPLSDAERVGAGTGEERRLKEVSKKVKQLLLATIRSPKAIEGQRTRRRKQSEYGKGEKQQSWPPNPPPPLGYSYSFDASSKGRCLPIGAPHPPGDPRPAKKFSNYHLFLRSIIEKNDFYSKKCNVHSR